MFNTTPEQIAAANKANVEALMNLNHVAFEGIERLLALNLNTVKAMLEDSVSNAKAALAVKDVQEFVALQTALAQPAVEKAVAYSKSVYEIASETKAGVSKLVEAQAAESSKNFTAMLDKAAKSGPAGSDVAISAMKSAIAAANSAYENMSKAGKQFADMAEANVAAATSATEKAVGSAAKHVKKAA
jgi:phasin family protein